MGVRHMQGVPVHIEGFMIININEEYVKMKAIS